MVAQTFQYSKASKKKPGVFPPSGRVTSLTPLGPPTPPFGAATPDTSQCVCHIMGYPTHPVRGPSDAGVVRGDPFFIARNWLVNPRCRFDHSYSMYPRPHPRSGTPKHHLKFEYEWLACPGVLQRSVGVAGTSNRLGKMNRWFEVRKKKNETQTTPQTTQPCCPSLLACYPDPPALGKCYASHLHNEYFSAREQLHRRGDGAVVRQPGERETTK